MSIHHAEGLRTFVPDRDNDLTRRLDEGFVISGQRFLVGKAGFEPATSASRTQRPAKLGHFPCAQS